MLKESHNRWKIPHMSNGADFDSLLSNWKPGQTNKWNNFYLFSIHSLKKHSKKLLQISHFERILRWDCHSCCGRPNPSLSNHLKSWQHLCLCNGRCHCPMFSIWPRTRWRLCLAWLVSSSKVLLMCPSDILHVQISFHCEQTHFDWNLFFSVHVSIFKFQLFFLCLSRWCFMDVDFLDMMRHICVGNCAIQPSCIESPHFLAQTWGARSHAVHWDLQVVLNNNYFHSTVPSISTVLVGLCCASRLPLPNQLWNKNYLCSE